MLVLEERCVYSTQVYRDLTKRSGVCEFERVNLRDSLGKFGEIANSIPCLPAFYAVTDAEVNRS